MLTKFLTFLKYEEQLVDELILSARDQQKALVEYKIDDLENALAYQNEVSKRLRKAEEQRVRYLSAWLKIPRKNAVAIQISQIEKALEGDEVRELRRVRNAFRDKLTALAALNTTNRILANRASKSVRQILALFSNGSNYMCNVRI